MVSTAAGAVWECGVSFTRTEVERLPLWTVRLSRRRFQELAGAEKRLANRAFFRNS
jgi:hypothetical protein